MHFRRKKTQFQGKRISAPLWELTSTGTEGHFERESGPRIKQKNSLDFFGIGASISPNSSKTSGTFVKTVFPLCKESFCSESNSYQKFFFILFGGRAWNFRTSGKKISALLPKLHFASLEDHSDYFSEHFLYFEPFRGLSSKCWDIRPKNFGTVFSKLHSSCTDEYVERKTVLEKIILHIISFF